MLPLLPPELISAIACRLSPSARDVLSLAQSCRSAYDAVWRDRADDVWKQLAAARWGTLVVDEPSAGADAAAEAAEAVGGWREFYLRRSSLKLVRGRVQPRRPASARVLFWGEEDRVVVEEEAVGGGGDKDDDATANDQNPPSPPLQFLALGPKGCDRSPLDLVQEAYQPEPWHVIVACMLIARTSGGATPLATIARFLEQLPTPTAVVRADDSFVESLLQPLGLQRNRRASVKAAGRAFLTAAWTDPSELRGCGKFCADSWRVFCRGEVARGVRGIEDAMLRQFVRWCGGGGSGKGGEGGGNGGAQKRRREAVEKEERLQQQRGGRRRGGGGDGDRDGEAAAMVLAAAKANGGRVTRARAAAAAAENAAKGGRRLRAARRDKGGA